jgi:hypothetical protein
MSTESLQPKKKMGIFKKIALVFLVLLVVLVIVISTRPAHFRYERSADIAAPADVVFPLINDHHQWVAWSPFEKMDRNMKKKIEGPEFGPGSSYTWEGNSEAGAGKSTIVDSKANEFVNQGNKALTSAKALQKDTRKDMCCALMMLLSICVIVVIAVIKPWKNQLWCVHMSTPAASLTPTASAMRLLDTFSPSAGQSATHRKCSASRSMRAST